MVKILELKFIKVPVLEFIYRILQVLLEIFCLLPRMNKYIAITVKHLQNYNIARRKRAIYQK